MDAILTDLRHALRLFRKAPAFATVVTLTLALGIGANTAIFSVVDAVIVRPLPYSDPDRLVMVWEDTSFAGTPKNPPAPGNFYEWRRLNRSFTDMAATRGMSTALTSDGTPDQVVGHAVTPSFFSVLGVQPLLGRVFTDQEDRTGATVAVISHGLWQRRYAGDGRIIGKTMLMSDTRYVIIGVMPPAFVFRNRDVDYWVPIQFSPSDIVDRGSHYLDVMARLKPGISVDAANADMQTVAKALEVQFPGTNARIGATVVPIKEELFGRRAVELLVLMGAAVAILLIACANLASLLLSRAASRRGELAIRAALGATPKRLVLQLLIEGMVLSLIGGALGLVLARWGIPIAGQLTPLALPTHEVSVLDERMLTFTVVLSLAIGVFFSAMPAVQAVRASLQNVLQQYGRSTTGGRAAVTRNALVVLQVAVALVLLVAAGLMLRTLAALRAIDTGFRSEGVLTVRTSLPMPRYSDATKRLAFYDQVVGRLRGVPGVESAAYVSVVPFGSPGGTRAFRLEGRQPQAGEVWNGLIRVGTGEYLKTLGVQLLEGRLIDDRDVAGAPLAVVINGTMARRYWPNASALGQRLALGGPNQPFRTIVGVIRDVRENGYELTIRPGIYLPVAQLAVPLNTLMVRVNGDPLAFASTARRVIASVDADQPLTAIRTMDDVVNETVADRREQTVLLSTFGSLALFLSSLGLYGVLAYAVSQRSREIGLRMALGATAQQVLLRVVAHGLGLIALGLGIGTIAAWGLTRTMKTMLYGVPATDPQTFASVVALLGAVALAASLVPAMRASRVDPMIVLRNE